MLIDCDQCPVRGHACGDCVVSVLIGPPAGGVEFDAAEQMAFARLAEAGLLPPLPVPPARPHLKVIRPGSSDSVRESA